MDFHQHPRTFLLLEDRSSESEVVYEVLRSPLELAQKIVCHLFRGEIAGFREEIDIIKEFAAGIHRALELQAYPLANYYSLMFAFQQWFHSSYRARQGKVLESILQRVLASYTSFQHVPSGKRETQAMLQAMLNLQSPWQGDIDVCGATQDGQRLLLLQLRSRDDTGGTTAKTSLVEALQTFLRTGAACSSEVLYLVGIWDERHTQQRTATIHKFYSALRDYTSLTEKDFEQIGNRICVHPSFYLQLAYGVKEILQAIFDWDPAPQPSVLDSVTQIVQRIQGWDDLWVAYAVASIEIQNQALRGVSNVDLLMQKCAEMNLDLDHRSWTLLQESVEKAVEKLIPSWTESTLPVQSPADQACYLRDLLFLRAIYERWCYQQEGQESKALKETSIPYQTMLWGTSLPESQEWPAPVNFRQLVPEITDTNYLTHSLFYYPAKFIPQIPRFCLQTYTEPDHWVIDPFAGSATVGLEAVLTQRHAILLDINPLLNHIVPTKILFRHTHLDRQTLQRMLEEMTQASTVVYRPAWSNLEYWYDPQVLEALCRYWGWVKGLAGNPYQPVLEIALLKASKHFSYAEHKTPKLFKSKTKRAEMQNLLQGDWQASLQTLIYETALDAYRRLSRLAHLLHESQARVLYYGGVDSADASIFETSGILSLPVQALITSPPYLQAQEYIRTAKLELYWLGYTEEEVKAVSRLEIPYRKAERILSTPTLDNVRAALQRADLRAVLDSYFYYTLRALENAARPIVSGGTLCIFVGNPKIDEIEVETWKIMAEYFGEQGYALHGVYEDEIKNRQLFRNRRNKNPEGMKSEFLLVMKKP